MRIRTGTSGFSYKKWKGSFYPDKIKDADMLAFYASKLEAVEINNTFYRMPRASVLEGWADKVPATFRFTLKASRRISHDQRLRETTADSVRYLFEQARSLGERLGPALVQLPPNFKVDLERLKVFLTFLPKGAKVAFEFRNKSWFTEQVYDLLRERPGATLCLAEDEKLATPRVSTGEYGYLRLRREDYDAEALQSWRAFCCEQAWDEAYVYFKHEDAGVGPKLAQAFVEASPA